MDVLQGALVAGAAATGIIVVEKLRGRRDPDAIREDVTELGTTIAGKVGDVAGAFGHLGGRVLGSSGRAVEDLGEATTRLVTGAGETVARGTGSAVGAYAGVVDRVVPIGRAEPETGRSGPTHGAKATKKAKKATSGKGASAA